MTHRALSRPTRAVIYARYSSDLQSAASIDDQIRICKERALRDGWTVERMFVDRAVSGSSMLRPGLQDLLAYVADNDVDMVVVEALDRLTRDQADVATLYKQFTFHGVEIFTLADGLITELHVGLKGTMNQLFLKDLAAKTRRGLRGRVEEGFSAGGVSYGYEVVRALDANGQPVTGERRINEAEAAIIRRIFEEFANGVSPKAIAKRLNREGIAGPRGILWRDTAIRGHRARGTGLLNNELYIGKLVWNRLRYVKDPQTGKRVSRQNPRDEWIVHDVPELALVDLALWDSAKKRQGEIDADPKMIAQKATRFWEHRREKHLLTGLVRCGHCGGAFASVGRDYLACSNARKLETCDQNLSIRRQHLEDEILVLIKTRLMQPDAVAEFVSAYTTEANSLQAAAGLDRSRLEHELAQIDRRLDGLYDAISEGLRTPGLQAKLESLEATKAELTGRLEAPAPTPVRFHPNLSEVYRRKVEDLAQALKDPSIRSAALNAIRSLIGSVNISVKERKMEIELDGAIVGLIGLSQPDQLKHLDVRSVKVVAGAGFEPAAFRL